MDKFFIGIKERTSRYKFPRSNLFSLSDLPPSPRPSSEPSLSPSLDVPCYNNPPLQTIHLLFLSYRVCLHVPPSPFLLFLPTYFPLFRGENIGFKEEEIKTLGEKKAQDRIFFNVTSSVFCNAYERERCGKKFHGMSVSCEEIFLGGKTHCF